MMSILFRHLKFWVVVLASSCGASLLGDSSQASRSLQETSTTSRDDDPIYQFEWCEENCDAIGQFCGSDLRCHSYNCEDWYELGHPNMTGYDAAVSTELECSIFESNRKDTSFLGETGSCAHKSGYLPYAVTYDADCRSAGPCGSNNPNTTYGVRFNRKCTAMPNATTGFICYDIAPDTNLETYFADYMEETRDRIDQDISEACQADNRTATHDYTLIYGGPYTEVHSGPATEEFNASLAASLLVSNYFVMNEFLPTFPVCVPGCVDTEFCGIDGACHTYDCFNVYKYGPPEVTGVKSDGGDKELGNCQISPPAECRDWKTGVEVAESMWPVAVAYRCQGNPFYGNVDQCAYPIFAGRYTTFNIYCTAQPNPSQTFSCYGIDPPVDTKHYMAKYLEEVALDSTCTANTTRIPDPAEDEGYYYGSTQFQACIGYTLPGHSGNNCALFSKSFSADEGFDLEMVRSVMKSEINGDPPPSTSWAFAPHVNTLGFASICAVSLLVSHGLF